MSAANKARVQHLVLGSVTEVCYVSHDARQMAAEWANAFDAGPFFAVEVAAEVVKNYRGNIGRDSFLALLGFSGSTLIEFVEPTNDADSVFREVLDSKGDGAFHHVMPNIRPLTPADFDSLCASYDVRGFVRALSLSPPGLGRNILFDAMDTIGSFIEVLEVTPFMYGLLEKMYRAHLDPVGHRGEVRPFADLMA